MPQPQFLTDHERIVQLEAKIAELEEMITKITALLLKKREVTPEIPRVGTGE